MWIVNCINQKCLTVRLCKNFQRSNHLKEWTGSIEQWKYEHQRIFYFVWINKKEDIFVLVCNFALKEKNNLALFDIMAIKEEVEVVIKICKGQKIILS